MKVPAFWSVLALWLGVCRVQAAAVFAHFMVTNTQNFTTYDWEINMVFAQQAHIDAFALNMAYGDSTNEPSLVNAFEAASAVGFQLFFSFDYAGNGAWPKSTIIDLITKYGSNSHYYQYKGKPFVSTFEGPGSASDWIDIKQTGCYFVPDWSSLGAKAALEASPGVPDGLFSWAGWPWGPHDMDTYVDASYMQYLDGKPYMMPVSPWFYTNLPGYKKNWVWNGDRLWFDRWQQVMYLQPEWVEIISWNDYGESHYIGPLHENAYAAFDIGNASYNYAAAYSHDEWRTFLPYLIDLYKTGTATITNEGVQVWFRRAPGAACTNGGTSGNTVSQFQIEFPPTEILQDKVFFSALLGSPADVSVSIGGVLQEATWSDAPDGGIGIYHGSVPFNENTGQVIVKISRNGAVIASMEGDSITTSSCLGGIQNWNAWVGMEMASATISATPQLTISEQVCVNGTGPNKFASLCGFSCSYGYCPVGACICTAMGEQRTLPNATGIKGYPLAGEDASYSGLCDFNCNYGNCDPEACGTTEVELTVPTVSDFSPPACVGGTGEGNLAGLCSFSCGYGFCPINACTCTGEGGLVLPPASQYVSGYAAPGMDATVYGPLCGFTCSHGYCPEGACATNPYGSSDGATPGTVGIKPLPCTSLAPSATFTLSAACTDGILNLPTSGPEASVNNIPAGSPAVCNEVCDFFRLLTGTCCGQGGNTTNTVEIVPSLVIPLDIPLPSGFVPNVPIIVPVPGKYDPDEVFGNPTSTPTTTTTSSSTTLAAIITTTFTTTYTSYSTFPVTQIDQNGQITTTTSSTPVVATSTGTTTTTSSGSKVTGSTDDNSGSNNDDDHTRKPRKTCRTIGAGTPLTTFLAHVPLPSSITLPAGMCLPGSDPLRIPPIPLPNTDPPCYKKDCSPCQKGACGGDRSSSGSSTGSTSPTDPTEPEQCAAGGSDAPSSERGT
ncbi:glycosyl hydrolase family 71-domain-containing protein [Aspergillus transmontanensis]|uniref:Glycosyl hydrolase family 71-domain-containing protein n=1 Tax=Aspergillus transmontanensis TaxID=1034304 RepID=A0A5N6W3E4_9EURO|nr:glycosyl hydrolase family 71-domain-containing protein [Aspergillus transmontanensis]